MSFKIDTSQFIKQIHPVKLVLFGYLSYILVGWLFLSLPVTHSQDISALDNLFTATSAVSTTGLVTISVSDSYSFFGQLVILILIQLGGIGYMTFGSFVILSRKGRLSPEKEKISGAVFALPRDFRIDKFIKSVVTFTFALELSGAVFLYFIFETANAPNALWSALFHSVSAFCTAGFSIYNNSFESFQTNFWLNFVISVLSYCGAIGFIVWVDVWRKVKGKIKNITLTSKIILHATFWLSVAGTLNVFLAEPSVQQLPPDERLLASFFQAMTSITTVGFNTIPIGSITKATMLLLTILMIIGASPSGTGGGLKSTTFSAMIGVMKSSLKGRTTVSFWGNEVPFERIWTATASLCFYLTFLVLGVYLLDLLESFEFERIVFEAASALGTVGLSMGITPELTNLGKIVVILLMFVGRLGPLTFGIALFLKQEVLYLSEEKDVVV